MGFSLRAVGSIGYSEECRGQSHAVAINRSPISTAKTKEKPAGLNRRAIVIAAAASSTRLSAAGCAFCSIGAGASLRFHLGQFISRFNHCGEHPGDDGTV
jgi:hypothetical protein